jgi:hypothetical protein
VRLPILSALGEVFTSDRITSGESKGERGGQFTRTLRLWSTGVNGNVVRNPLILHEPLIFLLNYLQLCWITRLRVAWTGSRLAALAAEYPLSSVT